MATFPFHGPYPSLGPFEHPIYVHFPHGEEITKLDFVKHRYMVRSQDQTLEDVLGDELRPFGFPGARADAATQRSWVTDDGLDLRRFSGEFLQISTWKAYLKNKTATPSKADPGALNEFLFNNYTLVIDFDCGDVLTSLRAESPGGWDDGLDVYYEFLTVGWTSDGNANQPSVSITTTEIAQPDPGEDPSVLTFTYPYEVVPGVGNYYAAGTDPATISEMFYDSPGGHVIVVLEYEWRGDQYLVHEDSWDAAGLSPGAGPYQAWYAPNTGQGLPYIPAGGYYGDVPSGHVANYWWSIEQPPDHYEHYYDPGSLPSGPYTIIPSISIWENDYSTGDINGRIIGAVPDTNFSGVPMFNNEMPMAFGRARFAVVMDGGKLFVSLNGGDVITRNTASLYMPRVPPTIGGFTPLEYFPIGSDEAELFTKPYEAFMAFPGIMRCMWLSRKKATPAQLKVMSVPRALPAADSALWKKMPDKDFTA